jgi:hypothetical protein
MRQRVRAIAGTAGPPEPFFPRPSNAEEGAMAEAETGATRTITAIFRHRDEAERAVERLRAAGVPPENIEIRPAEPGEGTGEGVMGALGEFLMPQSPEDPAALHDDPGTVVVATGLAPELGAEVHDILGKAVDSHESHDVYDDPEHRGAIGTPGGSGRATHEVDRLTGERIGGPR